MSESESGEDESEVPEDEDPPPSKKPSIFNKVTSVIHPAGTSIADTFP
jgi:hypothetical protein